MAETMVSVVAEEILRKAIMLCSNEISLLWGFKKETEKLAKKMKMIQALLNDADNKKLLKSEAVAIWVELLKDVALDADDVLDELAYETTRKKVEINNKVRTFFSSSNPIAFNHKMASKIKNVNLMLDRLNKEAPGIGLLTPGSVNAPVEFCQVLQTDPFVDDSEIVGRSSDTSRIVNWLLNSKDGKELPVVGIVGMAGQGKTTVAQLVYKNDEVVRHFGHRIWICVSDNFSVDRMLNEMVEALTRSSSDMKNREAIIKRLQDELNGKRFLLVLDDVWNTNLAKWNLLKRFLLDIGGSSGSKMIITTHSEDVCLAMQICMTHHLHILSADESWTLFQKMVFADGGSVETPTLVSIGKRILKRCGGVPLAIKAIAGVLHAKNNEKGWLTIEGSELWDSLESNDTVLPSLRLSYDHLPCLSLKQCFAYCSLFQKDSILGKDRLIQHWIAQGFLNGSNENHMEMEDVGAVYLNILLRNSLLQVEEKDEYGQVMTCKMHDLVHDLALDVSKDYCLVATAEEVNDETKVVNLSLVSGDMTLMQMSMQNAQRLRTVFCCGVLNGDLLAMLRKLRSLILNNEDILELPSSVGKLKHLRLVDVSETKIDNLPDSVVSLYNLQTLRLANLEVLPKHFGNLINLIHLEIDSYFGLLPGIGKLSRLRTLPCFTVSNKEGCRIRELGSLHQLRGSLSVAGLENVRSGVEARQAKIEEKPNLYSLVYRWGRNTKEECHDEDVIEGMRPHSNIRGIQISGYCGSSFPSWIQGPSCLSLLCNLVKIEFLSCSMSTQVPPLGCLPCLTTVSISGMDSVSCIGNEFYGLNYLDGSSNTSGEVIVFPALKKLRFGHMSSLQKWSDIDESQCSHLVVKEFPHLEVLEIAACVKLHYVHQMRSLTSLQELSISCCTELVCLPIDLGLLESLETLKIYECYNLSSFPDIHGLRSLRKLSFYECRKLTCLPEGIGSSKFLQYLRVENLPNLLAFPDVGGLQSLQTILITFCEKLSALPRGLKFCTSLVSVKIGHCPILLFPEDLSCLPSLEELVVGPFSNDLDYFPWYCKFHEALTKLDGNEDLKAHFVSLKKITVCGWPNLKTLPQELRFYSLAKLSIAAFEGLVALPEWLGEIKSLESIDIWSSRLEYFPTAETMQSLENLKSVCARRVPTLANRYDWGRGPEAHKVAHIPDVCASADHRGNWS